MLKLALLVALIFSYATVRADEPNWKAAEHAIDKHFAALEIQPHDLISQSQIKALIAALSELGYPRESLKHVYASVLPDNDFLVTQLRSESGRRFIREVASQKLIYDQLDRIAHESGGKELIRHLIRLPDGEQFVRSGRAATVPGMVELLPKQGSGKSRRVRDYNRPTGKIYTIEHLKTRLKNVEQ